MAGRRDKSEPYKRLNEFRSLPAYALPLPDKEKNKEGDNEDVSQRFTINKLEKPVVKTVVDEADPSILVVDCDEVFSLGYILLDRFAQKLKDAEKRAKEKNVNLKVINFGMEGYITDAAIKTLVQTLGPEGLSKVTSISLEGCSMVTDVGIHWLIQGISQNKQNVRVNINGCTKITDGGLATLINAHNVDYVEALATSISYLRQAGKTKGGALLASLTRIKTEIQKESSVIIVPVKTKHSLSQFLQSKKLQGRQPFHYHRSIKMLDWNISLIEVEKSHVLFEHILFPNPVHVIIPFDAQCDVQEVKDQVIDTIAHLLSHEQVNPKHNTQKKTMVSGSTGFMNRYKWSKCSLTTDGILRNTSDSPTVIGAVISSQPLSRSNNYFEVQCISTAPDTGLLIGVMHDIILTDRFPLESKERSGGAVDGHEMDEGALYGFGIKGSWDSEYVPGKNASYYFTKNGQELINKKSAEIPHIGMYPIIAVVGKHFAAIKFLHQACPPQPVLESWDTQQQYWTPAFMDSVLCDDRGILSYVENSKTEGRLGFMLCQEAISREHNSFTIKILDQKPLGVISLGLGPEDYPINRQPGWDKMSIGLHGDNGKIYVESGTGEVPSSGKCYAWQIGDKIKAVVSSMGEEDTIQINDKIQVDFYVNQHLMATVQHKMSCEKKGARMVFMIGLRGDGCKVQMINYRPLYLPQPPQMDMLTMGRSNFLNIYDDGCLAYRKFDSRDLFGFFMSKTPFNQKLTYFEMEVKNLNSKHHAGIGITPRDYPINTMVGWLPGSVGYHADNGKLYYNSYTGCHGLVDGGTYKTGDVVGCGFDAGRATFREDGSLENQQTLHLYFTKNGKKMHEVAYMYMTDGIYPAVNLHYEHDEVILSNYYYGAENGADQVDPQQSQSPRRDSKEDFAEGCRFTVVGLGNGESDPQDKLDELEQELNKSWRFPVMSVIEEHIKLMERNPNMMDMQGQQLYGQLLWQKECLERFLINRMSHLKYFGVDMQSGQGHSELVNHIVAICELDLANHIKCYDLHDSVSTGLKNIVTQLAKQKFISSDMLSNLVANDLGKDGRVFEAAVHHLHSKGYLIWIPLKRGVLAVDMNFAETLLSKSDTKTLSGKQAPCIGEKTQIWSSIGDILPVLKQLSKEQLELLRHFWEFLGLMEIPCLHSQREDSMFCYCTPDSLGDLPVKLSDFSQPNNDDVILICRTYRFLCSIPINFLSVIVTKCLLVSQAMAIAHDWCVFQNGAAQTTFYTSEGQILHVETRCFLLSGKKDNSDNNTIFHLQEYAFNIFCIFIDLIDMIIGSFKVKVIYTEKTPLNLVNTSIGCLHQWGLSNKSYRQTICTLCGNCCDKGRRCPYRGVSGSYQHQCGCGTVVTGCKDCGICQSCADSLWAIRSYLRPCLEVANYGKMKSNPFIPLNATTYDEIEFTNLGSSQAPICLKLSAGTAATHTEHSGALTKMFPSMATEFPNQQALLEHMATLATSPSEKGREMTFQQGDTVTVRLDPIKRHSKMVLEEEDESPLEITPVYFTSICREASVWHDTGIVVYSSLSPSVPVGQFIGSSPLTPNCPAFSFEILHPGEHCYIACGVTHKRCPPDRQPGWIPGSLGYHADDGGIFTGSGWPLVKVDTCNRGDVMKCEVDFQGQVIIFYKNGHQVHKTPRLRNFGNYHPAIGFHSVGEAVRLLEKEPWQVTGDEEPTLPSAFDSYKYGNMHICPGHIITMFKVKDQLTAWLLIHNPSKNIVGYKITSAYVTDPIGYLEPSQYLSFRLLVDPKQVQETPFVDIHWFLLESNRDYSDVDIGKIYAATTPESLFQHRLKVKVTEILVSDSRPLKLASQEPDANDFYLVEVLKNGLSVQKYWLREGNYVCTLPQECNVLMRYPKFPTLAQPNGFQKGMRVILDLTSTQKDGYAEAMIEEVTIDGLLRLEYSQPGESINSFLEASITSPEIAIKEIEYEYVRKGAPDKSEGKKESENSLETERVAAIKLISYRPRGHTAITKRAYQFPPFHLLTEASRAAIMSIDGAWKANTLNSLAQCRTLPTRVTVQELQISQLVGSNLDWLAGANPSHKFDLAFVFLPSRMGHKELCYPRIPLIFQQVDVHRLCFLVDQMYYNQRITKEYEIILDAPVHFVNVPPVPPNPPLTAEAMFASSFNGWTYTNLYSNKLFLPLWDKIFTGQKPDFKRQELEQLMKSLLHLYAAQCHILAEQYGGLMFQTTPEDGTSTITNSISYMDKDIIRETDKAQLDSDILIKKAFRGNVYCKAHQWCLPGTNVILEKEFDFRSELFRPYEETINLLYREMPILKSVCPDLYSLFPNLQYIELQTCEKLRELPSGISQCLRLAMVSVKNSVVEVLPQDLFETPHLLRLHCANLKVKTLPSKVLEHSPISELILSNLLLTSVPKELGRLTNLELLNLNSNPLETLPMELATLTKLKTLLLNGIPWLVTAGSAVEMPLDQFEDFLKTNTSLLNYVGKEKLIALFHNFDCNKNSTLDINEVAQINAHLFWTVPRIGSACINCSEYGGIPPVVFLLSSLETLNLDFQAITAVPVHMCRLRNLKALSISNNPLLESLPGSLGHLPSLKFLRLISNPSLRTPPHEVVSRGFAAIKAYLKRLAGGFTECRRTKLMLVGLGGAGKTSLLRALISSNKKSSGTKGEDITNGIDIFPWTVQTIDNIEVTYNTWDFAGQTLYYNTHQFFLSKRAVYLLLWSTRQGYEHSGLEFWLSSIASHAPKTPIFVVGTHCDQVPKADIPMSDLQERYPQIVGFHFVSSLEGIGIVELEKNLLRVTLEQKNMGEKVPKVWLNMEKKILGARNTTSILPWKVIREFGMEVGIFDEKDIREAIQFLHELGTVQYFDNEFLREQVVINPQWIVNVMSCVVSVKDSPIQENKGHFLHKYIPTIWRDYPTNLHPWLLRLTEEFDLTFPLPDDNVNIVPCLLPQEVPKELNWPVADVARNLKETKLIYRFTYLPTGLFNRAQVRLFQLSDGKLLWKRGSLLKKNQHQALISQTSDWELQVKVQGPRPENVLFLIHEIFESLIEESFHGVHYELLVPCPDCILKEGTLEPSMFEGSLVKRAREHSAPFLQCRKYFHTISMAQLYEVMPSTSTSDFDAHLQNSLTIMQQLNAALSTDVAIIYSARDMVGDKDSSRINPEQIKKDIEDAGLRCWFSNNMNEVPVQDVMLALKNCKMVAALLSNNFERDPRTRDLLLYTLDTLGKDCTVVVLGEHLDWENTDLGMRIGKQEVKVMIKTKSRYEARKGEIITSLKTKLKQNQMLLEHHPSVFISYCWSNSRHAQSRGTICREGAIGWGDPREIKVELEKQGISCWLDFDQLAAGKGLFQNIAKAIKNSKVLVAFVSDEYVQSDNCMMELRFGVLNMNLPTIIAVVGTGKQWKQSEVGILMQRSRAAKVYFQEENPSGLDVLENFIRERLPENADQLIVQKTVKETMQSLQEQEKSKEQMRTGVIGLDSSLIQEEYELMQRKFMRHIIAYVSNMDSIPTPRLIIVDFEKSAAGKKLSSIDTTTVSSSLQPRSWSSRQSNEEEEENDKWENEPFCIKILCEDEKGWHLCKKSLPRKLTDEFRNRIHRCSAYLARMFAILRQSAVTLNCFEGSAGAKFTSWIEESAVDNVNFLDAFIALRTELVEDNEAQEFLSQLHRCHLPTGKIYWLCDKHGTGPRITRLSTETARRGEVGRVMYEEDTKLKEHLEHSQQYNSRKEAKNPSAGIILPPMFNMMSSDDHQASPIVLPTNEPKHVKNTTPLEQGTSGPGEKKQEEQRTTPQPSHQHKSSASANKENKGSKTCTLQ